MPGSLSAPPPRTGLAPPADAHADAAPGDDDWVREVAGWIAGHLDATGRWESPDEIGRRAHPLGCAFLPADTTRALRWAVGQGLVAREPRSRHARYGAPRLLPPPAPVPAPAVPGHEPAAGVDPPAIAHRQQAATVAVESLGWDPPAAGAAPAIARTGRPVPRQSALTSLTQAARAFVVASIYLLALSQVNGLIHDGDYAGAAGLGALAWPAFVLGLDWGARTPAERRRVVTHVGIPWLVGLAAWVVWRMFGAF